MSKYTYHIAFNVSDYTEVFPENRLKENGFWEGETWIDRIEIGEVKLHKRGNETVYNTISAWVIDPTKYSTDCFFKIQKAGVDWHTYLFRVRWGFIDAQTGVYRFNPQAYDSWFRYFGFAQEENCSVQPTVKSGLYYEEYLLGVPTPQIPYVNLKFALNMFDTYNTIIQGMGTGLTVKSSILNEDTTSVLTTTTTDGKYQDYVTNEDNYFLTASFSTRNLLKYTVKSVIEILEIFQIFPFFESATVLRLEHVKYMIAQLKNNAVSLTLDADEQELEYLDKSVPFLERLSLFEEEANTDPDFENKAIKYAENKQLAEKIVEISNSAFTDYQKYQDTPLDYPDTDFILSGHQQEILEFTSQVAGGTWTFNKNTFSFVISSGITTDRYMLSNYIKSADSDVFNCVMTFTSTQPGIICYMADIYDVTTPISNVQVLSNGTNTFNLTVTTGIDTSCFVMRVGNNNVTLSGVLTVRPADANNTLRIASAIGSDSGDGKLNAPFSQANIIQNWWSIYRPTNSGTINGVAKTFTDSQFIMRRQLKKRYWPNDINMQFGINDGSRVAKIERYTRDLDTDFVEFTLLYQEYE